MPDEWDWGFGEVDEGGNGECDRGVLEICRKRGREVRWIGKEDRAMVIREMIGDQKWWRR